MARSARCLLALSLLLAASRAHAYRPFEGTDGDTAALGEFELELGPGLLALQGQHYLEVPSTVLNFGILPDTELVIDLTPLAELGAVRSLQLTGDDVFLKHTFRQGILQGKTGLSIAAEGGVLTPELSATGRWSNWGASIDFIESYRWAWTTLHFNEQLQYARDGHPDLYAGVIIEGPPTRIRPVAELYVEGEDTVYQTESLLLGGLWTVSDSLVIDLGLRGFVYNGTLGSEVRAGLTWTVPLWGRENEDEQKREERPKEEEPHQAELSPRPALRGRGSGPGAAEGSGGDQAAAAASSSFEALRTLSISR